ncbi:MAG: MinD/ParA family protein [Pseudomonadota bacterium]
MPNHATAPTASFEPQAGRVIAVASGKGGVGKTWASIALAQALTEQRRKILLFDGDLGLANVDVQLGLMPNRNLSLVLADQIRLKDAVISTNDRGFDVIAGASGSGDLASVDPQVLVATGRSLKELAKNYHHAILDLGAGIGRSIRFMSVLADTLLVITTDEPTSITDAYALMKIISTCAPGSDIRIVVNMAATLDEGQRTYSALVRACQTFLGISPPLAGVIRRDPAVREAIRAQTPLLSLLPASPAAQDVKRLANRLDGLA